MTCTNEAAGVYMPTVPRSAVSFVQCDRVSREVLNAPTYNAGPLAQTTSARVVDWSGGLVPRSED